MLAKEGGDVQRRAAVGVLDVRAFALGDELLDLGDIAARGRVVQPGIDAQLALAGRDLRKAGPGGDDGASAGDAQGQRQICETSERSELSHHGRAGSRLDPCLSPHARMLASRGGRRCRGAFGNPERSHNYVSMLRITN